MPHILLTNDDGIDSPGLAAIAESLADLAGASIVAPIGERSGAAHSISVRRPVVCEARGEGRWAIDGTPADAVIIGLNKLLERKPDMVISGINHGANVGQNIHYSGTVGAALEAAVNGIPSFALSLASRNPNCDWSSAARLGMELARLILEEGLPAGILLNVNVPETWNESGRVRFTRQSQKITRNVLREEPGANGPLFWLQETQVLESIEPDTDYAALQAGDASLTPLSIHRTDEPSLNHLSHLAMRLELLLGRR
jgi:5'-nucleotidase